jgi:sialidase-1
MRRVLISSGVIGLIGVLALAVIAADKQPTISSKTGWPIPRSIRVTAKIGKFLQPDELITYKTVESGKNQLKLHVFRPPGWKATDKRPVLVTYHGGGWAAGEPSTQYYMADWAAKRGWVGISVSYRLCNSHHPSVTPFDSVKDARSAVRFVRAHAGELGIDPERLMTNGGSAGGHLAAAGLFNDVNDEADDLKISAMPQAMLLMYPVIDTGPGGYGNKLCGENWRAISPVDRVTSGLPPTLIMHGDRDDITPYAGAKRFHENMLAAGNDITFITGKGGHGYFTYTEGPYAQAMEQIEALVKSKGWPTELVKAEPREPRRMDLFDRGEGGYHTYRIPAIVMSLKGALLAFCEGRKTSGADHGDVDLVMRRSTDGGKTWSPLTIVHEEGGDAPITIGNPVPVLDRDTGIIWLFFCRDNKQIWMTRTSDEGQTWEKPVDMSATLVKDWSWVATGPGHGIQMSNGRLIIPTDCQKHTAPKTLHSFVIYSDDHGHTWKLGDLTGPGMNECQAAERADGSLILSMRNYLQQGKCAFAVSKDGGVTWSEPKLHEQVDCPVCEASIVRYTPMAGTKGKSVLLHSGPALKKRLNLTIRVSEDEGETWPIARILHEHHAEYSDLIVLPSGEIGCFYERDGYKHMTFTRFDLDWLRGSR